MDRKVGEGPDLRDFLSPGKDFGILSVLGGLQAGHGMIHWVWLSCVELI